MRRQKRLKGGMKKVFCILVVIAVMGGCKVVPSERTSFCFTCHRTEGVYKNLDVDASYHADYQKKQRACIECHPDKSLGGSVQAGVGEVKGFLNNAVTMDLYAFAVFDGTDHDGRCLSCHTDAMGKEAIEGVELSPALKELGLRYDHAVHRAYKEFTVEEGEALQSLRKKAEAGALSEEEAGRLELLSKVERANCAACHERIRVGEGGERIEDKNINYAAGNPMLCTACHYGIDLTEHPGKKGIKLPSEESCRRCHDGRLHGGNLRIFLADCANDADRDNCVRCHPLYKGQVGEYF